METLGYLVQGDEGWREIERERERERVCSGESGFMSFLLMVE